VNGSSCSAVAKAFEFRRNELYITNLEWTPAATIGTGMNQSVKRRNCLALNPTHCNLSGGF
jgi:hypothetical protein